MATVDTELFSLKEAAVLAGLSEEKVRREIEARVIDPEVKWVGRAPRRYFREPELYYLSFIGSLADEIELSRPLRARVYRWFLHGSIDRDAEISPVLTLNYERLAELLEPRLRLYRRGRERIESRPEILGGEPVFAGTRLSVRHVGAMRLGGEPTGHILEDYPYLTEEDVEFAALYTEANPPVGRPKSVSYQVRQKASL